MLSGLLGLMFLPGAVKVLSITNKSDNPLRVSHLGQPQSYFGPISYLLYVLGRSIDVQWPFSRFSKDSLDKIEESCICWLCFILKTLICHVSEYFLIAKSADSNSLRCNPATKITF